MQYKMAYIMEYYQFRITIGLCDLFCVGLFFCVAFLLPTRMISRWFCCCCCLI